MSDLRYPVGKFQWPQSVSPEERARCIETLSAMPAKMRSEVAGLSENQLDTPYREGGWTVRQVVHHVPESHMNSFVRFKLALTEDVPTIRPYDEAAWAQTADARSPIESSLELLDPLHKRWIVILNAMSEADWQRKFRHPEREALMELDKTLAMYAWHCKHHVAHITNLRERMGW